MAAIGRVQLSRFEEMAKKRRMLAKIYVKHLSGKEHIQLLPLDFESVVPHIFVVKLDSAISRDAIREKLLSKNIQTGIHYQPNHFLTLYKDPRNESLEITEEVYSQILSLPLHFDLSQDDVRYVCDQLLAAISG